jgi:hypothetical protein
MPEPVYCQAQAPRQCEIRNRQLLGLPEMTSHSSPLLLIDQRTGACGHFLPQSGIAAQVRAA